MGVGGARVNNETSRSGVLDDTKEAIGDHDLGAQRHHAQIEEPADERDVVSRRGAECHVGRDNALAWSKSSRCVVEVGAAGLQSPPGKATTLTLQ